MRMLRKKVYGYVRYIFLNVENRIPNATFRIANRRLGVVNRRFSHPFAESHSQISAVTVWRFCKSTGKRSNTITGTAFL